MLMRTFQKAITLPFTRVELSRYASTFASVLAKRRQLKYTPIATLQDLRLGDLRAPNTQGGLEALAADAPTLRKIGTYLMGDLADPSGLLYANDPGLLVTGHQYAVISERLPLSDRAVALAIQLGPENARRLLFHCMPNGALEYPASDKQRIEREYMAGRISKDVPTSNRDYWMKKAQINSIVLLGAASFVAMKGYPAVQMGGITILPLLATTLLPHIFTGSALWLPMLNSERKTFRFAVLGIGQAPVVELDILNNPTAGLLWTTLARSSVYLLENYEKLEQKVPGYVLRLHEPGVAKSAWSDLPANAQWDRYFLEKADSLSGVIAWGKWALGGYYNYQPDPADTQAAEKMLKEQPLPPQLPLVSEQELQDLSKDKKQSADNLVGKEASLSERES